jgi:hypothetical protein
MTSFTSRLNGIFETALSVIGAVLLVIQTVTGADGIGQIAAALVALIAPICAAIRSSNSPQEIADMVADAIQDTFADDA